MAGFLGKGWKFPVEVSRMGGVGTSEEEEAVRQSIQVILGTAPGERLRRPEFGCRIHDLVFAPNNSGTVGLAAYYCEEAVQKLEPRIFNVTVDAAPADDDPARIDLTIRYQIRSTNNPQNLVFPFYVGRVDAK